MQVYSKEAASSDLINRRANNPNSYNDQRWTIWAGVLITAGILLRLFHFFDNRSFWIDEVYLSSSLIQMNFTELMTPPLLYEQKAPIGYLWTVKVLVLLFGNKEMALRLFPLICGILSLFLFLPVARYFLKPLGVVVAVGILALAPPVIYHAVEAKQYATELLATVIILRLYIRYQSLQNSRSLIMWGVWGALVVWFSYSSIFVLAGLAAATCLYYIFRKEWPSFFRSIIPFSMWMASFMINYFLFTYKHAHSEWLEHFFETMDGFMPFPPFSLSTLKWFFRTVFSLQNYPLGLWWGDPSDYSSKIIRLLIRFSPVTTLVIVTGLVMYLKESKKIFMVLVFPILLALLASGLKLYPFYDRLVLFLAPMLVLFLGRGSEKIAGFFPGRSSWQYIILALLLAAPLASAMHQTIDTDKFGGFKKASYREAMLYVNKQVQPGDVVYIYWNFMYAYRFYKATYPLKFVAIEGKDLRSSANNAREYISVLRPDLDALARYKRVWVLRDNRKSLAIGGFLHKPEWYTQDSVRSGRLVNREIIKMGRLVETLRLNNVTISLTDLSSKSTR